MYEKIYIITIVTSHGRDGRSWIWHWYIFQKFNDKSRLGNANRDLNVGFMKTWWSYFQQPRVP